MTPDLQYRRRTRVVGAFRGEKAASMLVAVILSLIAKRKWGANKYIAIDWLKHKSVGPRKLTDSLGVSANKKMREIFDTIDRQNLHATQRCG